MPHTIPSCPPTPKFPSSSSLLVYNGEPEIGILALALANGAPLLRLHQTLAARAALRVVLMNDVERQIRCRYALLTYRCVVDERRLLGGGTSVVDDELMDDHERWGQKPQSITCASSSLPDLGQGLS